jgi:hypothetical protein
MITCRHLGSGNMLSVFLLGLVVAFGCGDIPGDAENTGSILNVESMSGFYNDGVTNQVDVLMDNCTTGGEGEPEPEYFSDHFGQVEVTNRPLPNTLQQTASPAYIRAYTITYQPIVTPSASPPALDPYVEIPLLDSRGIPPCLPGPTCAAIEYTQLKFVDVAKKLEYLNKGGNPSLVASYNVRYTFYGENIFGEEFTFGGGTNCTFANYDYCN